MPASVSVGPALGAALFPFCAQAFRCHLPWRDKLLVPSLQLVPVFVLPSSDARYLVLLWQFGEIALGTSQRRVMQAFQLFDDFQDNYTTQQVCKQSIYQSVKKIYSHAFQRFELLIQAAACPGNAGIALVVAGTCAPVRAREALRASTARLLEQLGDFAFYTLGEFCQARDALSGSCVGMVLSGVRLLGRLYQAQLLLLLFDISDPAGDACGFGYIRIRL